MTAILAGILLWLSGLASAGALLIARDILRRRDLPPGTRRQIRAARSAQRLQLPRLYARDPEPQPDEDP